MVAGSSGRTPNSWVVSSGVSASDAATPSRDPDGREHDALHDDQAQHGAGLGPEGQADADLRRSLASRSAPSRRRPRPPPSPAPARRRRRPAAARIAAGPPSPPGPAPSAGYRRPRCSCRAPGLRSRTGGGQRGRIAGCANDDERVGWRTLLVRNVHLGRGRRLEPAVPHVADHADDRADHGASVRAIRRRLPIGSAFGNSCRAIVWLMTTTEGASAVSVGGEGRGRVRPECPSRRNSCGRRAGTRPRAIRRRACRCPRFPLSS